MATLVKYKRNTLGSYFSLADVVFAQPRFPAVGLEFDYMLQNVHVNNFGWNAQLGSLKKPQ